MEILACLADLTFVCDVEPLVVAESGEPSPRQNPQSQRRLPQRERAREPGARIQLGFVKVGDAEAIRPPRRREQGSGSEEEATRRGPRCRRFRR